MASEHEAERADARALQREKERERRRLRDRQRRQNMSQEQREKHLARRRRNYQLRRLRAQNAQLLASQQTHQSMGTTPTDLEMIKPHSSAFPQLELPVTSTTQDTHGAQKMKNFPKKLRVTDVKHLARRLHSDGHNQTQEDMTTKANITTLSCASAKRLRLIHVKRLARSIK